MNYLLASLWSIWGSAPSLAPVFMTMGALGGDPSMHQPADLGAPTDNAEVAQEEQVPELPEVSDGALEELGVDENTLWARASESGARADFEAYLDAYPDGQNADIAQLVLDKLDRTGADNLQDASDEEPETTVAEADVDEEEELAEMPGVTEPETDEPEPAEIVEEVEETPEDLRPAQAFKKGNELLEDGHDSDALAYLQSAADRNHAPALMQLGKLYRQGDVVEKNLKRAANYFAAAGENGDERGYARAIALFEKDGRNKRAAQVIVRYYQDDPDAALDQIETADRKTVKSLQRQMKRAGFYPSKPDGAFGPASRKALRRYAASLE